MKIHVARDGQELGQLPPDEVQAGLAAGKFLPTDLAWAEGQTGWVPLSSFPGLASAPPPVPVAGPPELPSSATARAAASAAMSSAATRPPTTSGVAVASLVLGILSVTILPILASIPAVICGHVARSSIRQAGPALRGEGLALAGLIMGYLGIALIPVLAILAGMALPIFTEVKLRGLETKSLSNAKQIGLACKLYAQDHHGDFPKALDELVPDYLPDRSAFICPLSGPSVPIGYLYFGGKETDPEKNILLASKILIKGKRRVVIYVDCSGEVTKSPPVLPSL